MVLASVLHAFPPPLLAAAGFVNKPQLRQEALAAGVPPGLTDRFKLVLPGAIKYVYATGIGPGAARLPDDASLADANGMPLELKTATEAQDTAALPSASPQVVAAAAAAVAALGVAAMYLRKA